jgi:hypothetical protein
VRASARQCAPVRTSERQCAPVRAARSACILTIDSFAINPRAATWDQIYTTLFDKNTRPFTANRISADRLRISPEGSSRVLSRGIKYDETAGTRFVVTIA